MNISLLKMKYEEALENYNEHKARVKLTQQELDMARAEDSAMADTINEVSDSIKVVQTFSDSLKTEVIKKFEELITRGVREIFDKDYKITIEFESKGNNVSADFYVLIPSGKKVNLAKGEGGGLRDFVAVLQRVLYMVLDPSRTAKFMIFDEDLKHLDTERSAKAFPFLVKLFEELDIQVLFITHSQAARALSDNKNVKLIEIGSQDAATTRVVTGS
jgi:DNA repair exonuclease SbcCD ATPase subunit